MAKQIVISPNFCVPTNVKLTIVRKPIAMKDGNFGVFDEHGNAKFKVKEKLFSLHSTHVLLDYKSNPIVFIKKKILTAHKRWQVLKENAELIFSVKKASVIQLSTELDIYLAGNHTEKYWDFKMIGSWFEKSYIIYDKDSKPIARMHKKHIIGNIMLGKDNFDVEVSPNVDHAFIVTLLIILYEINEEKDD